MKFNPKVSRTKRYAELHGNMQKCRIKSLYGNITDIINTEHLEHLNKLAEMSESMKRAFNGINPVFQQIAEQTERLNKMFKAGKYRPALRQLRADNRVNSWEALT
jgi:hypothetical protein